MKKLALHWQVIIGLILGTIYAFFAVKLGWNQFTLDYIMPFGTIFISLLKLIAVPLVLFSVISGIISLKDVTKLGRIGIKTLSIYLITTMFAVSLGLVLVNIIQPGKRVSDSMRMENRVEYELWRDATPGVMDLDEICLSCDEANKELIDRVRAKSGQPANAWVEDKLKKADVQKGTGPLQPLVDIVPTT